MFESLRASRSDQGLQRPLSQVGALAGQSGSSMHWTQRFASQRGAAADVQSALTRHSTHRPLGAH